MEAMTPFDLIVLIGFVAIFILGYFQGLARRSFGLLAVVFSLLVAAQIRTPLGSYLAGEWTTSPAGYSSMIAFGGLFVAFVAALTLGIQLSYKSAPVLTRYPVLDEVLGGVLGLIEGVVFLVALVMILDPYYLNVGAQGASIGEFLPLRTLHENLDGSLTASIMRDNVIPAILSVFSWLFPDDVVHTFVAILSRRA
jgi:uncharacterized membrane protein required for colicin V production